jgi:hypothetical protein
MTEMDKGSRCQLRFHVLGGGVVWTDIYIDYEQEN